MGSAPSAPEPGGISAREFARRDGCSEKLVRDGINRGALRKFENGKLDPEQVGTGWRASNRRAEAGAEEVRTLRTPQAGAEGAEPHLRTLPDDAVEAVVQRIAAGETGHITQAEAERRKAVALALTRELDFDLKSGAVVPADAVLAAVGAEYARVRTRLLAIPAEHAPRLHRLRTPVEVQDALLEVITQALEELASDGAGGAPG